MTSITGIATEFINFTRASNATVTDSDGKIKWAPHNLLTNSESFASSPWAVYNATIASNFDTAPNGTTTADRFTIGGIAPSVYVLNGIGTGQHTAAFFAKAGTSSVAGINVSALGNGQLATFNLSTLATSITALGTGGTVSGGTASITAVGNGWFYCVFANVTTTGTNNVGFSIEGTSGQTGLIWGAHLYRSDLGGMQANTSAYPMYNPTTPKNLLGYTEDFSNAAWTKASTTVTANAVSAPNGLQTADLIYPTTTGTLRSVYQASSGRTVSVYAKAAGKSHIAFVETGGGFVAAWFNLSTGVKGTGTAGYEHDMEPIGDGWYRCWLRRTSGQSFTYAQIYVTDADNSTSVTANGTDGIYIWGAQLSDSASLDTYSPVYGAAVTSAAYYGPRRDFDSAGVCKGLLVEEQRVNSITSSNDLTGYQLTPATGLTSSLNAGTAPDGTNGARLLTNTTTTEQHRLYLGVTLSNTTTYTYSVYAKRDTADWMQLTFLRGISTTAFVNFNLATGAKGTEGGGGTGTITPVGNGWYRCTLTATTEGTSCNVQLYVNEADSVLANASTTGTVKGLYVYGAQLEAGSFATSYIPTGAATATRSADVASVSTQAFPYSATAGSFVANFQFIGVTAANPRVIGTELANDAGPIYAGIATQIGTWNGSVAITAAAGPNSTASPVKASMSHDSTGRSVCYAAGTVASDANTMPVFTEMRLGSGNASGAKMSGWIRQITYLPRRISNTELQQRTQ